MQRGESCVEERGAGGFQLLAEQLCGNGKSLRKLYDPCGRDSALGENQVRGSG